ncbi:hypothetical protein AB0I60_36495 [Actinosynnema sp. NPDC050436]|uniref:hypothetical protein n=1 Tax=Actinosynnema sp. NPDC050436 TaxID=3155659 RepID=UPI0034113C44
MRSVVLLLFLLALHTLPVTASAAGSGLHDCAAEVADRTGTGRCSGTGTFRVLVACEDGRFARGPWLTIDQRRGTTDATCGSRAVGAEVEELLADGTIVGA